MGGLILGIWILGVATWLMFMAGCHVDEELEEEMKDDFFGKY